MNNKIFAKVNSIETFGSVDGPGVRFVVFLKGCTMRCKYCHNPETWFGEGDRYTAGELLEKALKYKSYWGKSGGVTVSGGEPLMQMEFLTEFFRILKENGIHTALDTSGQTFQNTPDYTQKLDKLLDYTDLVLLDLKMYDSAAHRELTGLDNGNIFEFARYLSDKGIPMWIRHVLVPGITDSEENLRSLANFIKTLETVEKTEILPYHTLGIPKWENLKLEYPLKGILPPTAEDIERAKGILL